MNISDITERYREDPQDARVLADRKVDVIIHVASADQKPDMALFDLIKTAVTRSKDQAVKRKYSRFTGDDRRWADTVEVVFELLVMKSFRNSDFDMRDQPSR